MKLDPRHIIWGQFISITTNLKKVKLKAVVVVLLTDYFIGADRCFLLLFLSMEAKAMAISARHHIKVLSRRQVAEIHALRLLGRLKYLGRQHRPIAQIATLLSNCNLSAPCYSGICPRCNLSSQRQFLRAIVDFVQDYNGETLHAVTIVLPGSFVPHGRLSRFLIENHKRSLRYRLSKAGCGLLFGVIEFDFVEHSTGRDPPGWLPHLHGLLAASDLPALRSRFKSAIVRTDVVLRPVTVKQWDGLKTWLRYCSKVSLKRRLGFDDVERFNTRVGTARFCRVAKTKDLLSVQLRELAVCLHDLPLRSRLFAYRAQWRTTGQRWHLVVNSRRGVE